MSEYASLASKLHHMISAQAEEKQKNTAVIENGKCLLRKGTSMKQGFILLLVFGTSLLSLMSGSPVQAVTGPDLNKLSEFSFGLKFNDVSGPADETLNDSLENAVHPGLTDQEQDDKEKLRDPDILPFVTDKMLVPRVSYGFSFSRYSPDLSRLATVFTAIENEYRRQGYNIYGHRKDYDSEILLNCSIKISLDWNLSLLMEAGVSAGGDADFKAASISVLYYPKDISSYSVRPYIGAGLCHYYFSTRTTYGLANRISPTDYNGEYTYLDYIEAHGAGNGLNIMSGIEINSSDGLYISPYAGYILIPAMETPILNNGKADVKLSGFSAGIRLMTSFQ